MLQRQYKKIMLAANVEPPEWVLKGGDPDFSPKLDEEE